MDSFLLGRTGKAENQLLSDEFWPWQTKHIAKQYFMQTCQPMNMMFQLDFYDEIPQYSQSSKELFFQTRQHFMFDNGTIRDTLHRRAGSFPSAHALPQEWYNKRYIIWFPAEDMLQMMNQEITVEDNTAGKVAEFLEGSIPHNHSFFISSDLVLVIQPGRDRLQKMIQNQDLYSQLKIADKRLPRIT
ncbi:hypothetical protein WICPIJ_006192 [Wickerhamomyces pijperi]|uniref:Uncharacterized protein n=1 Tax=Wickerhamomyces pijperi TaxID=599730 RepID=A0A9P8Q2L3_WICPI|nr:hypothetical protein WICPIJ_006192 [Wickerhamomyces pijperi]